MEGRLSSRALNALCVVAGAAVLLAVLVPGLFFRPGLGTAQDASTCRAAENARRLAVWSGAIERYELAGERLPVIDSLGRLAALLEPTWGDSLPLHDAWGHTFVLHCWRHAPRLGTPTRYVLISPGRDGELESDGFRWYERALSWPWPDSNCDRDLALANGRLMRAPRELLPPTATRGVEARSPADGSSPP